MLSMPRENVQSYPRPPALEAVPQRVIIRFGGQAIADSSRALRVLETHHAPTYYIPMTDISALLQPVAGQSFCEWKGVARYLDVVSGGAAAKRAAWTYDQPSKQYKLLAGHVAFYAGMMDGCFVGKEKVVPQPGDFYGGWVTSNLDGLVKGGPGTENW